ncbi:MAG: hypothetical protein KC488_03005 [Candidatus Cloacimonetes bacterium]|nr:hypothetical protein [Candidatus Cloacimonadota bacterium]
MDETVDEMSVTAVIVLTVEGTVPSTVAVLIIPTHAPTVPASAAAVDADGAKKARNTSGP